MKISSLARDNLTQINIALNRPHCVGTVYGLGPTELMFLKVAGKPIFSVQYFTMEILVNRR